MSSPARLLAPLALVVAVVVGVGFALDGGDDPAVRTAGAAAEPTAAAETTSPSSAAPGAPGSVPTPEASTTAEPAPVAAPDCTIDRVLRPGDTDVRVECLESVLAATGHLAAAPDQTFDPVAESAVEAFQSERGLEVDGIVGPATAAALGAWPDATPFPPDPRTCSPEGRSAVVDRRNQRAWLCADGAITREMPITTAVSQPDPGTYQVYAKDLNAASTISGSYTEMTHFVAFTYGKYQGARIAFHSVPTYPGGGYVQPLDSVGTPELFGASSGCIRVLPDDAVAIWDWLAEGDDVIVIS